MKPQMHSIFTHTAEVFGTTLAKILCRKLETEQLNTARCLAATICDRFYYNVRAVSDFTSFADVDVRTYMATGGKKMARNEEFRAKYDLVMKLLDNEMTRPAPVQRSKKKGLWHFTRKEEEMIKRACLDAEVYMQTYGGGEPVRYGGVGYYPIGDN